jgi:hypothetical protein
MYVVSSLKTISRLPLEEGFVSLGYGKKDSILVDEE